MVDWHADETGPPRRSADDYGFFRNTDWRNWNSLKILFHTIVILSLSKATRQKFFLFSRRFQGFQGFLYLLFHYCHPERCRRLLGRCLVFLHAD